MSAKVKVGIVKEYEDLSKEEFKKVKAVSIRTPLSKRKKIYGSCIKEMEQLVQIYSSYPHLGEIITKIKNVMKKIVGTLRNLN